MKTYLLAIIAFVPLFATAQNNKWENPEQEQQLKTEAKASQKSKFATKGSDNKYLVGAVPEIDGHVVFTLNIDVPGQNASEIYQKVYNTIDELVRESKAEGLQPESRIAAINKEDHIIAARFKEWLVFSSNLFSLDRTEFIYTLIAQATDGHLKVTMERIKYAYETNQRDNRGFETTAEEWITDKEALNKRQDKLAKGNGKFRMKTIDRKDNIFRRICQALDVKY